MLVPWFPFFNLFLFQILVTDECADDYGCKDKAGTTKCLTSASPKKCVGKYFVSFLLGTEIQTQLELQLAPLCFFHCNILTFMSGWQVNDLSHALTLFAINQSLQGQL